MSLRIMKKSIQNTHEYIAQFDSKTQDLLNAMLATIREAAPDAVESISYGMPAFKYKNKPLAYVSANKNHIGFYATPSAHSEFAQELAAYKVGKGSVQFPYNKPLPLRLVTRIINHNMNQINTLYG